MTIEPRIVFDLSDVTRIRMECARCGVESVYSLKSELDSVPCVKKECDSCGYVRSDKVQREAQLLSLLRGLVREPSDKPAVCIRMEIEDPYRARQ